MLAFNLPYPPSVNHYWRTVRGRMLISREGRQYRDKVALAAHCDNTLDCRLSVTIAAFMPDRRKRDLDNITKAVLDAMTHAGVWQDDGLIDELAIIRKGVEKPGRVIVTVRQLP